MRVHFSQPAMPGRGMPGIQHIPLLTLTAPMMPPPAPMMPPPAPMVPPPAPMEGRGAPASPEPKRKLLTFRDHGGHEEMLVRSGNSMYCVRRDELMCFYDLPLLDAMRILGVGRCTLRKLYRDFHTRNPRPAPSAPVGPDALRSPMGLRQGALARAGRTGVLRAARHALAVPRPHPGTVLHAGAHGAVGAILPVAQASSANPARADTGVGVRDGGLAPELMP
jgi:hypothetical protein